MSAGADIAKPGFRLAPASARQTERFAAGRDDGQGYSSGTFSKTLPSEGAACRSVGGGAGRQVVKPPTIGTSRKVADLKRLLEAVPPMVPLSWACRSAGRPADELRTRSDSASPCSDHPRFISSIGYCGRLGWPEPRGLASARALRVVLRRLPSRPCQRNQVGHRLF